jgi:transcriptional regulator with XRE-family HTH domain
MTPFGQKVRELRRKKGVTQRALARALRVSPAYLSALENGKKGRPPFALVQDTIAFFGVIWDDAEEIAALANLSNPRAVIDTSRLSVKATELANRLASSVHRLPEADIERLLAQLNRALKERAKIS